MSKRTVNSLEGVGARTPAISIDNTSGTCTANITNNLSNKNLVVNGACLIAQRGTSNTAGGAGYFTGDRFYYYNQGIDNDVTKAQADVASGTTPYSLGFRKSFKLTNGDQSGGVGSNDMIVFDYKLEAQDLANSGWNYTSSSSFITLSFWVKSSVPQNFYVRLKTSDGTAQNYTFETGSLTTDTWTKITKTISGNSNLQFDNNNGEGLDIEWSLFRGTDSTGSMSLNTWAADNTSIRTPDQTSTWYTTNNATFEITGVQLEVGSVATDFEHRSFGQELALCQRYFYMHTDGSIDGASNTTSVSDNMTVHSSTLAFGTITPPVTMRSKPSLYSVQTSGYFKYYNPNGNQTNISNLALDSVTTRTSIVFYIDGSFTAGQAILLRAFDANAKLGFNAEL